MEKVEILGVQIDPVTMSEAAALVEKWLEGGKKHYIVTPNPEIVMLAQKDKEFCKILNSADLAIPDGVGLLWASKVLGLRLKVKAEKENLTQRVTGVDLMEKICQMVAERGFSVGLLGGKNNTAAKSGQILLRKFPKLKLVVFTENKPIDTNVSVPGGINKAVDILFVAFGAPKQEKWIFANLPKIPVKVAMAVGGAFEMIAGIQRRAPKLVQNLGFEWLWRLAVQPWRIKRQIALIKFVFLVIGRKSDYGS